MPRLLLLALVLLLFGSIRSAVAQSAPDSLAALIPAADALPEGCAARVLDDSAPPFLTANPQASTDPDFVSAIARMAIHGDVPADGLQEALMGVYDAGHELGILAFRFADAADAQQTAELARSNQEAQVVLVQGGVLAMVWRDGPEDACFQAVAGHVQSVME